MSRRRRHANTDPLPVSLSPLHAVGDRIDRPDLGEGCYSFNSRGAHDPLYYCTCDDVEGVHSRRICGKAYKP